MSSKDATRRVVVEVLLPSFLSEVSTEPLIRKLKREVLESTMYVGHKYMFTDPDTLILECHGPLAFIKAWPLRKQAVFHAPDRVLVRTEASVEEWMSPMDDVCNESKGPVLSRGRWKSSRLGGRPWAAPSATTTALAASRRRTLCGGKSFVDHVTEVRFNGEAGGDDKDTIDKLLSHVDTATGLMLRQAQDHNAPEIGSWMRLATFNPAAPSGRARLHLGSQEDVQKVYSTLHGQVVQVGADMISITVHNDLQEIAPLTGNGWGVR